MKILFVMRHSGYVRNFESTLRMLCDRGHKVDLAFQIGGTHWLLDRSDVTRELADTYPRFSRSVVPVRDDSWSYVARELRLGLDYLRYLGPEYRNAPKLRARAERDVPEYLLRQSKRGAFSTATGRAMLGGALRTALRAIPTDARIDAFLEVHRPHVLALTPLIEPGAPQAEYVRSARALGIPTALCVASWDNLTNKGLIQGPVDLVTVWNDMMKDEAVTLHRVPAQNVVVTGAQPFDHWFDWQPSVGREAFCQQVGLPVDRPYILYVCSSRFIAPEEVPFVRSWLQHLRQSGVDAGVLVRPHPQNADQWRHVDLSDCGPAVVWPLAGATPSDAESRADYFNSIVHSAAVVGINTTAEIESAIVGRPVFTILAPDFHATQEGTLHFEHLRHANNGLLHVARTFAEHVEQLGSALRNPADDGRCRRFVEAFVRPFGVDVPATPKLVEALESLARQGPKPAERSPWWAPPARRLLIRRGNRLRREALLAAEKKALRPRRKNAIAKAERPQKSAPLTWRELAPAFRALSYEDRVRFGQAIADRLPGELLLETAKPERLDYADAEIFLRVISKKERERLKACAKEPFTIDWIHRWIAADDVLYDIGANVGAYSLVAVKKPGGAARVFAFEPSYANVSSLCANIVLNDAADDITPIPFALAGSEGLTVLSLRALEPGSARHTLGDGPSDEGPAVYRQPVVTFRLDDLVARLALPLPNHIKLDVDGGELSLLEGAAGVLASPALQTVLVEVTTSLSEPITSVLAAHGLSLNTRINIQNKAGDYRVWYGLFTRTGGANAPHEVHVQHVSR
jgi:FkbM family methyltransferase